MVSEIYKIQNVIASSNRKKMSALGYMLQKIVTALLFAARGVSGEWRPVIRRKMCEISHQ